MKTATILMFLSFSVCSFAQSVTVQLGGEKSVKGTDYSVSSGYEHKTFFGIGGFYQARVSTATQSEKLQLNDPFYGVYTQVPLVKAQKMLFLLNLRTGLVNEKFFVVVPALETRIQPLPRWGGVFGMSLRHGYPSVSFKVITKIF